MDDQKLFLAVKDKLGDPFWRLNNLYWIVGKDGREIPFRMNAEQEELYRNRWYQNVILKARQLGFSTLICMMMLDACLFDKNTAAGIVDVKLDEAEAKIAKIKFAYDKLPASLRDAVPLLKANASELQFGNGSQVKASTSHRGGTLQFLHVSEYGKICAKYPERAAEIRTGALNTVQAGNLVFIESTAEGASGHFFEVCQTAQKIAEQGRKLTKLDFKFHFFPWWTSKDYRLDAVGIELKPDDHRYFAEKKKELGLTFTPEQKAWYAKKRETQSWFMKREFPTTPGEAFQASVEGAYYGEQMDAADRQGRITTVPPLPGYPVHSAWDLGKGRNMPVWCFQIVEDTIRVVDYIHDVFMTIERMCDELDAKGYKGIDYVPHDARAPDISTGKTRVETMIRKERRPALVPMHNVEDGINAVQVELHRVWFDEERCRQGIEGLRQYQTEFDEKAGAYKDNPKANWAAHPADAFRYLIMAYRKNPAPEEIKPPGKTIQNMSLNDAWKHLAAPQKGERI